MVFYVNWKSKFNKNDSKFKDDVEYVEHYTKFKRYERKLFKENIEAQFFDRRRLKV